MKHLPVLMIFLVGLSLSGTAQEQIGMPKTKVQTFLKKRFNSKGSISGGGDSIRLSMSTGPFSPASYIYTFDKKGICTGETIITRCDSCYNGLLASILAKEKYQWKKINENQYISRFEDNRMIEIFPDEKERHFSILQVDWNREIYDMLLKN